MIIAANRGISLARISAFSISILLICTVSYSCSNSERNGEKPEAKAQAEVTSADIVSSSALEEIGFNDRRRIAKKEVSEDPDSLKTEDTEAGEKKENPEKQSGEKEKGQPERTEGRIIITSKPVQFCQGKYKQSGITGMEIITVKCPNTDDRCSCEIEGNSLREFVKCGEAKKNASKGSNIVDCDSVIVGIDAVSTTTGE